MHKQQEPDRYAQSGVYKLTCSVCKKVYVGQTGRSFKVGFNEHRNAFKTNSHSSNFAKHLTEKSHSFNSLQNTMQILKCHSKCTHLKTIQRYCIYLTEVFPCFFLGCKANARVKPAKMGHGPHSSIFCVVLCIVCM